MTCRKNHRLHEAHKKNGILGGVRLLDLLLKSISDDAPSGANLEYEPDFAALELAAQYGEERQAGDEILPAKPPNYAEVIEKAGVVLAQSHDLRAAIHMAAAELNLNGFPGFAQVTTYIRGCLEEYWDTCHPQLDAEDDDDPTMRVNAVLGLSDAAMTRQVRLAPLTQSSAFGQVTLRDIDVANGDATALEGEDRGLDKSAISAAFKDTSDQVLQEVFEAARGALDDIKAIDAIFNDKTPGQGPDLSAIQKMLQRAVKRLAEETGESTDPEEADGEVDAAGGQAGAAVPSQQSGAITSPRDVEAALDRILVYYSSYEPSSPLPVILNRAKRLVGADFMTIIKDIAPGGIDNVNLVGGLSDQDEN